MSTRPGIELPEHWSPEQARAALELCTELADWIQWHYDISADDCRAARYHADAAQANLELPFDDELPF